MTNAEIAKQLYRIAEILSIIDENPFRIRAYERAALTVQSLTRELKDIFFQGGEKALGEVPGIGTALAAHIKDLLTKGRVREFEQLEKKVPKGLLEIMRIEGMGPKKTKFVWKKFGVRAVSDLEHLAKSGKLMGSKGWGEQSAQNVLRGIELARKFGERVPLSQAWEYAQRIIRRLKESGLAEKIEIAGSVRRMRDTIGDIDVLATTKTPERLINFFSKLPEVQEVESKGPTKCTVLFKNGMDCDLRVLKPVVFGAALHYFTGSKQHNVHFRTIAVQKGLTVSEYGVFRGTKEKKGKLIACHTEEDVFKAIGLPFIPPELREDSGEIEAAYKGRLPKLIEAKDIKGDLHTCHSKFSDGSASTEEMFASARRAGLQYVAITDHASVMGMVKGIKVQVPHPTPLPRGRGSVHAGEGRFAPASNIGEYIKLARSAALRVPGIKVYVGAEVDILADGSLYLPDEILKQLDWVVGSIHQNFRQSPEVATRRLIKAMENPYVRVIGHPTTRILGQREGMEFEWEKLLAAAKRTGTFLELNASAFRLDLSDVHLRAAKEAGVKICINSDAHHPMEFDFRFGVATARRGWIEKGDIINALPAARFEQEVLRKGKR